MKKPSLIIILFFYTYICVQAQALTRINVDFLNGTTVLKMALAGGLNSPQYNSLDMNADGKQDLFVFDRVGNVALPFINNGTANTVDYRFASEFLPNFPTMNDWALFRDYNGDGVADIFTYSDRGGGIRIFKGKIVNQKIQFDRLQLGTNGNILNYPLSNGFKVNLYVNNVDIPAIDDIDGDGDLDILAFEVGGGHVYWYKNLSVERNFKKDSLIYELADDCWGRFYDNGFQPSVKLGTETACATSLKGKNGSGISIIRHPGATLATYDKDNDGDKDLLIGSVSYANLTGLTNSGTKQQAWMSAQDNRFPSNTEGVNLSVFAAPFFNDVDNDGKIDLQVAPNSTLFVENLNCSWFYKNTGTSQIPNFVLQQKDFLNKDMIDLGSGSNPTLVDVNGDGLLDLIVGNYSFFMENNARDARLFYFQNIGTASTPKYKLESDNWLNFKQYVSIDVVGFAPTFGDLDNDGDLDLIVGEDSGTMFYGENKAGAGKPLSIPSITPVWKGMKGGSACHPTLVDLNRDGLMDIVTGTRNGVLFYFQNKGTSSLPDFNATPNDSKLGRIIIGELGSPTGYAAPTFIDFKGKYNLFVGSEKGQIWHFDSIENRINDTFRLRDRDFGLLREGGLSTPFFRNINGDSKLEMVVGNNRGGLSIFKTYFNFDGTTPTQDIDNQLVVNVYPNPFLNNLQVEISKKEIFKGRIKFHLINMLGQIVHVETADNSTLQLNYTLNLKDVTKGFYLLKIEGNNFQKTVKVLKQ
jgi:Secretion system C-terminal sorting domain/FG-GAP-like repeat